MKSTPAGKVGMLQDRPVFVGIASGVSFAGDQANQPDFLTPYLSAALSCIGLNTVHYLPLQATAFLEKGSRRRRLPFARFDDRTGDGEPRAGLDQVFAEPIPSERCPVASAGI